MVAEGAEVPEALQDALLVVEHHLSRRCHPGERVSDRDRGDLPDDRGPVPARRSDRHDHEPVDALVDESPAELELTGGQAVSVRDKGAEGDTVELSLDGAHELLVPEVAEAADEQSD